MARVIDWIVQAIVGLAIGVIVAVVAGMVEAFGGRPAATFIASMQRPTFIGWIGGALAAAGYHVLFEWIASSTVGKRIVGVQVIDITGMPINLRQATKRSLGFFVDALFFGAIGAHEMAASATKQRIGDRWADTRVVRRRSLSPNLRTPLLRMVVGFAAATCVGAVLTAATQMAEYLWFVRGA